MLVLSAASSSVTALVLIALCLLSPPVCTLPDPDPSERAKVLFALEYFQREDKEKISLQNIGKPTKVICCLLFTGFVCRSLLYFCDTESSLCALDNTSTCETVIE
jgi:hypothetical protein